MQRIEDLGAATVDGPLFGGSGSPRRLGGFVVAKGGQERAGEPLPCQAAWCGSAAQEEPAIARTRVKSASRGEVSTEINLVTLGR